ncbi:BT_3987 domain-containing protein [Gaoshiqia sp. Z1-71]|uniref:BT_3987 domain-containing protein n=1 Tax=Gaoshiqia hydrogeniformans TaxID=3290090 RepID=UPI003BF7E854
MKKKKMFVKRFENIKSWRKVTGLLLIPAMFLVSCSDDSDDPVVPVSVSFLDAVNNPNVKTIELADTTFKFGISSDGNAEGNITATVGVDLSLVSAFNTANQTEYLPMVNGSFELSGSVLVIPDGGVKSDSLSFTVKPVGKLEREKSYLLPVKISGIEGNGTISATLGINYFVITVNKEKEVILEDVNRSKWEIQCSSEELKGEGSGQGKAIYLLDNNIYTFWHSLYTDAQPTYPHWLVVDMNEECSLRAFWIVNCQEDWATSVPKDMYFEVSSDGANWTRVANVTATPVLDKQVFQLDEDVTATYFKVTFETSASDEQWCYLGELGASYNSNK